MKCILETQSLSYFNLAVALITDLTKNMLLDDYHESWKARQSSVTLWTERIGSLLFALDGFA